MTETRKPRRNEEEQIADLEAKIKEVEDRLAKRKARETSAILKDWERCKKHMAKFAQTCLDKERQDVTNTVMGFMSILDRMSNDIPAKDQAEA